MLDGIDLNAKNVLLVGCGGAAVINFPGWLFAINRLTTSVTLEAVLTGAAQKLVATDAVTAVLGRPNYCDGDSFSLRGEVLHRYLAEWPDLIIVAPISLNTLTKSALLISDTLVTSVLNMTQSPVHAALSFPEHLNGNPVVRDYKNRLTDRDWKFYTQRDAFALATGSIEKSGMIDFYSLLKLISSSRIKNSES